VSSVFYRDPQHAYPEVAHAEGLIITDTQGRQYLDMSGGAAVASIGHAHPEVAAAVFEQLGRFEFAHTAFFTSRPQEDLAQALVERFGVPGSRVYFTSGGSEANETAMKMAWQYWAARGQAGRKIVISRQHSYHGNTLGALSVSGNEGRRAASAAPLLDWPRIAPFYPYRELAHGETLEDYARRSADALEAAIEATGPERVAAFICEPVVGASLGAVAAEAGYLARVRAICDRYEVLLIADEIMCGSGRSGTFFAIETDGVAPDIATLAKGIASGYQPLAATVVGPRVWQTLNEHGFLHGHTYVGHPAACAAGLAVLRIIERDGLLKRCQDNSGHFMRLLEARLGAHPNVGDIRGRGLLIGVELVADRASKRGFPAGAVSVETLRQAALDAGLICYPGGWRGPEGFVPHVLLAPPLVAERSQLEEGADRLGQALETVFQTRVSGVA